MMTTLMRPGDRDQCDFTSFETLFLGGSAVPQNLIDEFKVPKTNSTSNNIKRRQQVKTKPLVSVKYVSLDSVGTPACNCAYCCEIRIFI